MAVNEKRLIDANALKKSLERLEASGGHKYYRKGMDDTLHFHMPHIIDEQITVDAVEVVRCRECYFGKGELICSNPKCTKSFFGCPVQPEHFCSYGERKDNDL